jgi:DNA-binding GntR family transcriptional regulator
MIPPFDQPPYRTVRGHIAEAIRKAILDGGLRQGERLVERKLASLFGTSLSAVREALIELQSQGFITKTPNSATFVTKFTPRSTEDIYAFRCVVETYAVEQAARLATPEQIAQLEKLYFEMLDSARAGIHDVTHHKDLALHEMIWRIANNESFEIALQRVLRPFLAFSEIHFMRRRGLLVENVRMHLPVLEAIKSHNPKLARKRYLAVLKKWRAQAIRNASEDADQLDVGSESAQIEVR